MGLGIVAVEHQSQKIPSWATQLAKRQDHPQMRSPGVIIIAVVVV